MNCYSQENHQQQFIRLTAKHLKENFKRTQIKVYASMLSGQSYHTSLKLMVHLLGIPSSLEDLDVSKIRVVYYWGVDRIAWYCELDVITTVQVFLGFRNDP